MNVRGRAMRTIWLGADGRTVEIIDQTRLPHELVIVGLETLDDAARAITTMQLRGAPLIGAAIRTSRAISSRSCSARFSARNFMSSLEPKCRQPVGQDLMQAGSSPCPTRSEHSVHL